MDDRKKMSKSLDKMIYSCQFAGSPCNLSLIEHIWNRDYGNCYRLNSYSMYKSLDVSENRMLKVKKEDTLYGFFLNLNLDQPKELDILGMQRQVCFVHHSKFRAMTSRSYLEVAITKIRRKFDFFRPNRLTLVEVKLFSSNLILPTSQL